MAALAFLSHVSCLPALGAWPWSTSLTQPGLSLLLSLTPVPWAPRVTQRCCDIAGGSLLSKD